MTSVEPYRPPRENYQPAGAAATDNAVASSVSLSPLRSPRQASSAGSTSRDSYVLRSPELGETADDNDAASKSKSTVQNNSLTQKTTTIHSLPQRMSLPQRPPAMTDPVPPPPASASTKPRPDAPLQQWCFTEEEVVSTTSVIDGISPAEERLRRAKGVNFIYQAGGLLELPQMTLWVAGVFFHRFYMRYSLVEQKAGVHHYNIAATALFLANKTEEICRKTKDIIIAVAKVGQKNLRLIIDEQSKDYWRWRDSILMYEEMMLEALTFDLMVENPYEHLRDIMLRLHIYPNRTLRQAAWAFCNDACLTNLPLLLSARDVAISAIFFASIHTNQLIDDVDGQPWWVFLHSDEDNCARAIRVLCQFYTENPLRKPIPNVSSPSFVLNSTRRTGEALPRISPASTPISAHEDGAVQWSADANGNGSMSADSESRLYENTETRASPTPSLKRKNSIGEEGDESISKRVRMSEHRE
ncbi:hypothetical protein Cpir12675_003667 [Ceratocystis pirilliformis]|uniref:RNA polymerase II holoenzyme cyclin-like subunit n=1 Tax=Ceratocystis pirilliformis TaxID=259994 RepID=A0ABR3Z1L7_9PEZI